MKGKIRTGLVVVGGIIGAMVVLVAIFMAGYQYARSDRIHEAILLGEAKGYEQGHQVGLLEGQMGERQKADVEIAELEDRISLLSGEDFIPMA